MNTNVALEFNTKLTDIQSKISKLNNIGFNITNFNNDLNSILKELNNNLVLSKQKNFEGFLVNDYTNALNKLNKLDYELEEYNIYFKAYYYI